MSCAKRTLRIEALEQKQLLAGDVVVNVVNGVLTLQGDELANQVVVSSGEDPGTFVIHGLDGTQLIRGDAEPATELVVEGVRQGLRANLGAGDDVLRVENATIRGNVAINMGGGDDRVSLGILPPVTEPATSMADGPNVKLGANVLIDLGGGNDAAVIDNAVARGALNIAAGNGDDIVRLGRPAETLEEPAAVQAEVERPSVNFARGVHVALGAGDDLFAAHDLYAGGMGLHVDGGRGADSMRVVGAHSPILDLNGGLGEDDDQAVVQDSATQLLFVSLGGGDDALVLGGVKARLALLSGGPGEADTLTLLGENMMLHRRVAGFEIHSPSEDTATVA